MCVQHTSVVHSLHRLGKSFEKAESKHSDKKVLAHLKQTALL